ncbi:MAG: preprotein translocase subunit YajC [Actinobacteria bacterium]|nr:preprotein translocase subunit YajC [Actinomycetota bacterium]
MDSLITFLPIILIIGVFYLLVMRPQQKKRKALQEKLSTVRPGDKIMTTAGVFGTVASVGDDKFDLEIAPGVRVTMLKAAISQIVTEPEALPESPDPSSTDSPS